MNTKELIKHLSEFATENRMQTFNSVLQNRTRHITVVLEDIFQGHNASAVLRTCDCFGIQDIYTIENEYEFIPNPEVDMGSSKWLSIYSRKNATNTIKELKEKGYRIVSTTPKQSAIPLHEFDFKQEKIALLFGTELTGLSEEALSQSDEFIKIPMYGFTESFNISVSVSIFLSHLVEKLRNTSKNWKLNESEKEEILFNWLKESVRSSDKIIEHLKNNS